MSLYKIWSTLQVRIQYNIFFFFLKSIKKLTNIVFMFNLTDLVYELLLVMSRNPPFFGIKLSLSTLLCEISVEEEKKMWQGNAFFLSALPCIVDLLTMSHQWILQQTQR